MALWPRGRAGGQEIATGHDDVFISMGPLCFDLTWIEGIRSDRASAIVKEKRRMGGWIVRPTCVLCILCGLIVGGSIPQVS